MPFSNDFVPVNFINKSVQATGTPDIDATWLNYFQSEVDQIGDGLATFSATLETLQATVSALGDPFADPGYVSGLSVDFSTTTAVSISSGACYVPATANVASKSTATSLTIPGIAANTWYYIYAIDVGGALTFEAVTAAPVLYFGTARQKSGDSSRRYIGAARTNASAQVVNFTSLGGGSSPEVRYQASVAAAPLQVLTDGRASTATTVSCSAVIPVTSRLMFALLRHDHIAGCFLSHPEAITPTTSAFLNRLLTASSAGGLSAQMTSAVLLSSAQAFNYLFSSAPTTGSGLDVHCQGYRDSR